MSTTFQSFSSNLFIVSARLDSGGKGFLGLGLSHVGRPPLLPFSFACSTLSHVEPPIILRILAFECFADSIIFMRSSSCQSTTRTNAFLQHV